MSWTSCFTLSTLLWINLLFVVLESMMTSRSSSPSDSPVESFPWIYFPVFLAQVLFTVSVNSFNPFWSASSGCLMSFALPLSYKMVICSQCKSSVVVLDTTDKMISFSLFSCLINSLILSFCLNYSHIWSVKAFNRASFSCRWFRVPLLVP